MNSRRLSGVEEEVLLKAVDIQFGATIEGIDKLFVRETKRSLRIFFFTGDVLDDLRQSWIGLHLGDLKEDCFTPSVEGAEIIGRTADKNVIEISLGQAVNLFNGMHIDYNSEDGIYLLKYNSRVICAGKIVDKSLSGIIPKSRISSL